MIETKKVQRFSVTNGLGGCGRGEAYGDQRTLTERVDPILVPERAEQLRIQATLEDRDVELIVRVGVDTKVFDLVQRNRLVLGGRCIGRCVALIALNEISIGHIRSIRRPYFRITSESSNLDFTGRDGPVGIDLCNNSVSWIRHPVRVTYYDSQVRVAEFLIRQLRIHVDSRQPTAVTGMTATRYRQCTSEEKHTS
jgi:hypothetical protein